MKIFRIICWLKTIWYSKHILWNWQGFPISGHDYVEQEDGSLICEMCGYKSPVKN